MRLSKPGFPQIVFGLLTLAIVSWTDRSQAFGASESILWNFGDGTDGAGLTSGLIMDTKGNLYGTSTLGGTYGFGTVFELTPPSTGGGIWSESVIWNFANGSDGDAPRGGVVIDSNGNLYGTTTYGGAYALGTVFKLAPPSSSGGSWTESIIWSFGNGNDGYYPFAGLIIDKSGNLYGTTAYGGPYTDLGVGDHGDADPGGTAFELTPPASDGANWSETILWDFGNGSDGQAPLVGLLMDSAGNLYGTTFGGGAYDAGAATGGTVFELSPATICGGDWIESVIWSFIGNGTVDAGSEAGLTMDADGNLYGTNAYSTTPSGGVAFELSPPSAGGANWEESILLNLGVTTDDNHPESGLVMDSSGNLYGTTGYGGTDVYGTAYELTPPTSADGNWGENILWNFGAKGDGVSPAAGLLIDTRGNLYGTTYGGGTYGGGIAFELPGVIAPTSTPSPTATPSPTLIPTPTTLPFTPTPIPTLTPTPTATPTPTTSLSVSPARLNFGKIDATASSKTKKLTLGNRGAAAAVIGQLFPPDSFAITNDTCSNITLEPKDKCTVEIAFTPTTLVGSVSEALAIPYNGLSPVETLEGNGIAVTLKAPTSKVLPRADAGSVGKVANVTISNRSAATVQLGAASGLTDFTITTDDCAGISLAPKASCVVTVAFAPPADAAGELTSILSYDFTYGVNSGSVATTIRGTVK